MKIKPGRTYLARNGAIVSFAENARITKNEYGDEFILSTIGLIYGLKNGIHNPELTGGDKDNELIKEIKVTYEEVEDDDGLINKLRLILNEYLFTMNGGNSCLPLPKDFVKNKILQIIKTVQEHDNES